jgi:hypothetical protein
MSTIEYGALKEGIIKLPVHYYQKYLRRVVNEICNTRPELFFRLSDDLPKLQHILFQLVDRNRQTVNKLKAVPMDSPSKKDFFRKS